MIGVTGQYLLSFDFEGQDDFIQEADFISFTLEEVSGNMLPMFRLDFKVSEDYLHLLNEKSDLNVSMGRDEKSLLMTKLYPTQVKVGPYGTKRTVSMQGLLAQAGYLNNTRTLVMPAQSAVEAVLAIAGRYFKIDTNIEKSADKQPWVQSSIPDKNFLTHLWLRAHVPDSWLAVAISAAENTFILRDIRKLAKESPKWHFVHTDSKSAQDITINGSYSIEDHSGFINQWIGYAREEPVFDFDGGYQSNVSPSTNVLLAPAQGLSQRAKDKGVAATRAGIYSARTENMHEKYHEAFSTNRTNLALFSAFRVKLSYDTLFHDLRLLDPVMFEDYGGKGKEYASGNYLISKIRREFETRRVKTYVDLTRESPGSI